MNADTVRQMYDDGLRRWPSLTLEHAVFVNYCAALFATSGEALPAEGAELVLCCACAQGDAEALRLFERETLHVARAAIAGVRRDREFLQETLQEVWDKLFCPPNAKIAKYTGRGPLQAWVRVTVTRAALDRCRALGLTTARETELTDRLAAPRQGIELLLSRARYGAAFQNALREAVAALPPRDRNALRMHVCGQCSIDEIGRAYGVHRATAARWLERARTTIRDGVRGSLLRGGFKLTESEYSSLARGMASELEMGLSGSFVQVPEPPPTAGS
jgi:RNA polymerase sigma-70 factor (ECF subfamily)